MDEGGGEEKNFQAIRQSYQWIITNHLASQTTWSCRSDFST